MAKIKDLPLQSIEDIYTREGLRILKEAVEQEGVIGDTTLSLLPNGIFQKLHGNDWVLSDGRSIKDTKLSKLINSNTCTDLQSGATSGSYVYVRVN